MSSTSDDLLRQIKTALAPLTGMGASQYVEDVAAAADPTGPVIMAVRRDTLNAAEVSADGDNIALKSTNKGQLHTKDSDVAALIGEVQANPTANSLLDRVKALLTGTVLAAGVAIIGKVGIDQTTPGVTNAVQIVPAYKAALSSVHGASAATTNAQLLGSGTKMVMGVDVSNTHATNWAFIKFFNKATTPTPGTDTPIRTIAIPPNSSRYVVNPFGRAFSAGIGIAITGAFTDLDTTAVLLNQVYWEVEYV
jgi:hypothetical protein